VPAMQPVSAPKGVSTYRVGKIATGTGQALCIVRMISPHAIALDIEVPFRGAEDATLTIGKENVTGGLVMLDGKRAELRTLKAVDAAALLADHSLVAGAGRRTLPRLEVDARIRIEVLGQGMTARVCDISTDGMKVLVDDLLCSGDRVLITMRGLETRLAGLVRWVAGDHAGIEFDQQMQIGRLNLWLAAQTASPPVPNTPDWGLVSRS
jgi:hypothetical protein